MKISFMPFAFLIFFSLQSHAFSSLLTWTDWNESQNINTAIGKWIVLNAPVTMSSTIVTSQGAQERFSINEPSIIVQREFVTREDYSVRKYSDDEAFCTLKVTGDVSLNNHHLPIFVGAFTITKTQGQRGYSWNDSGKFSWVSADFESPDGELSGNLKCERINSNEAIGYLPFIKLLKPIISLKDESELTE